MTTDDYKAALETTRKLMKNMQRQNKLMAMALKYYADPDNQRDIALVDRGSIARRVFSGNH